MNRTLLLAALCLLPLPARTQPDPACPSHLDNPRARETLESLFGTEEFIEARNVTEPSSPPDTSSVGTPTADTSSVGTPTADTSSVGTPTPDTSSVDAPIVEPSSSLHGLTLGGSSVRVLTDAEDAAVCQALARKVQSDSLVSAAPWKSVFYQADGWYFVVSLRFPLEEHEVRVVDGQLSGTYSITPVEAYDENLNRIGGWGL